MLLVCAVGAQAQSAEQGRQRNVNDYKLLNSRIITMKGNLKKHNRVQAGPEMGKLLPDACEFGLTLKPGERAIEARAIPGTAVRMTSTETCEVEMEVGEPPETVLPPYNRPENLRPPADGKSANLVAIQASPGDSAGYMQGYYYDPVGIWVNSEQVNVVWNWFSPLSCAVLLNYWRSVPTYFYGWYNVYASTSPIYTCAGSPIPFTQAGGITYSNWQNNVFPGCLGSPANAYYNPIYAYGDNYGNLTGRFSWALTGPGPGCINLLNPSYNLVRTYN
jgi:hypothetical protein